MNNGIGNDFDSKVDSVSDRVKSAVTAGQEKLVDLKNGAVNAKDSIMRRSTDLIDAARAMVVEHPFRSVGIAFAAGYVGMRLLRRK